MTSLMDETEKYGLGSSVVSYITISKNAGEWVGLVPGVESHWHQQSWSLALPGTTFFGRD